ncbi:hypothetical protein HMPREF3088_05405 [Corynebacterium sp. HMSC22B11]|uniref:carbohydrate-binding protein n=1 Tax=Corynebacterium sp. HMSC22B11 TaxID=1581056 RepID=UPI0008A3B707|nr:carbohydrate-binding protein [Corynebacterium sp. HMSC22B11]OFO13762.1 hypothetical protein HMPREF3088_05405 [Corynebacterium sp. HMSC22B11]
MTTIKTQIEQLPDNKFRELKDWIIVDETARREQEQAVRAGQQEIIQELQHDGVIPAPNYSNIESARSADMNIAAWADPGTSHALMYPRGAVVMHQGRIWESGVNMNHWTPGAPGVYSPVWRDVTESVRPREKATEHTDGPTDAVSPDVLVPSAYSDGRDYAAGDVVVYDGGVYECTGDHHAAAGWTPVTAHGYWKKIR